MCLKDRSLHKHEFYLTGLRVSVYSLFHPSCFISDAVGGKGRGQFLSGVYEDTYSRLCSFGKIALFIRKSVAQGRGFNLRATQSAFGVESLISVTKRTRGTIDDGLARSGSRKERRR